MNKRAKCLYFPPWVFWSEPSSPKASVSIARTWWAWNGMSWSQRPQQRSQHWVEELQQWWHFPSKVTLRLHNKCLNDKVNDKVNLKKDCYGKILGVAYVLNPSAQRGRGSTQTSGWSGSCIHLPSSLPGFPHHTGEEWKRFLVSVWNCHFSLWVVCAWVSGFHLELFSQWLAGLKFRKWSSFCLSRR